MPASCRTCATTGVVDDDLGAPLPNPGMLAMPTSYWPRVTHIRRCVWSCAKKKRSSKDTSEIARPSEDKTEIDDRDATSSSTSELNGAILNVSKDEKTLAARLQRDDVLTACVSTSAIMAAVGSALILLQPSCGR